MARLIGRDSELKIAVGFLDSPGGTLLISGEAGVGKTRLIRELAARAEELGRRVVWGRPEHITKPGPFALLLELLQDVLNRYSTSLNVQSDVERLMLQLSNKDPDVVPANALSHLSARVRGVLDSLGRFPIAIFEDLHWADGGSQSILLRLARTAREDGFLLVASYRHDEVSDDDELSRFLHITATERLATDLRLGRLGFSDCMTLIREVAGKEIPTQEWLANISEGIPFFIEELVSASAIDERGIPDSISRVALARWQRLGVVGREVASVAALMSGHFDLGVLGDVCEIDRSTVTRALADGVRVGLFRDRDGLLVFRHALMKEALASNLLSVDAEDVHRRIAEAIQDRHRDDIQLHSKSLAHHWYQARDRSKALHWALEAGKRALALAAIADATVAFELAIACGVEATPPEALVGLAEVQIRDGKTSNAEELLSRAATAFEESSRNDEAINALCRLAWVRAVSREGDPIRPLDRALRLSRSIDDSSPGVRASVLAQKGQTLLQALQRVGEAEPLLREAAELAEAIGNHQVRAVCLDGLAWASEFGRRMEGADHLAAESCSEALKSRDSETIGRTHNNAALLLLSHGSPQDAISLLASARPYLERSFGRGGLAVIDLTEALAHWKMGHPNAVHKLVARGEVQWVHWRGYTRILQVWSSLHVGDFRQAQETVERYWNDLGLEYPLSEDMMNRSEVSEAIMCALLLELEVDDDRGSPIIDLAASLVNLNRMGAPEDFLLSTSLALRASVREHASDVSQLIEEMRGELQRYPSPFYRACLTEIEGDYAAQRQRRSEAFSLLGRAASEFEICSNETDRARVLRKCALAQDVREEKIETLMLARSLAKSSGSELELGRVDSSLRSLGIRPRVGRPRKTEAERSALSAREEQVAALVALGATNGEIANRLYLSQRTVQDHIANALRKIGTSGRASLAAWAVKHGLV